MSSYTGLSQTAEEMFAKTELLYESKNMILIYDL